MKTTIFTLFTLANLAVTNAFAAETTHNFTLVNQLSSNIGYISLSPMDNCATNECATWKNDVLDGIDVLRVGESLSINPTKYGIAGTCTWNLKAATLLPGGRRINHIYEKLDFCASPSTITLTEEKKSTLATQQFDKEGIATRVISEY